MAGPDNLFALDFDGIVQSIKDANNNLARRHEELRAALDRMTDDLGSIGEVGKAKRFAELLQEHAQTRRATRLEDTKPLRELLKQVEAYFKDMEVDAHLAQEKVLETLGEVAKHQ